MDTCCREVVYISDVVCVLCVLKVERVKEFTAENKMAVVKFDSVLSLGWLSMFTDILLGAGICDTICATWRQTFKPGAV